MIEFAAYFACIIFALLALFQIALVAGAPLGHLAWGGAHKVLPRTLRVSSIVAVLLYGIFATFIANKAGLVDTLSNDNVTNIGMWVITVYLALGTIMNALSKSRPERLVMTPVTLILTVAFLIASLD